MSGSEENMMQNETDASNVRRRRLSDESRQDGAGGGRDEITCTWNDSGDTHSVSSREAPTSKPDADASAKKTQLDRIKSLEASIADLKATVQMLAPSIRPDLKRTLAVGRQERLIAVDKNVTSNSVVDDNDGAGSVVSGGTGGTVGRSSANEDVEPADRHVYSSPAEVVRKVGSQLSGGFRRTFDVQADLVSLGILSEKTARDLVLE
ncbi:hypothetical protein CGLO_06303 [Colletotrichum gloeosporioides Cg-14]|uniref:Uncharacterized protein n=1 Tax=Colletotrichum gloeosporioides (strain Cg-14) TaxID=1237896 RepID=T0KMJ9_COLGC|nr:hypothetical protein CGLO_06303 [Colletotrichum gloeosporioides Cg-14]